MDRAWVFGGINALLGATVFAELGAMIPLSGGPASYPVYRGTRRLFQLER